MKRLVLASSMVVLGSVAAMAADGCPSGSIDTTVSPDAKSYSLLFDSFVAFAGEIVDCDIEVPLTNVPKGTIAVYATEYRGFMFLENAGAESSIDIEHQGTHLGEDFAGPVDEDVIYSGLAASDGDAVIRSHATVDMSNAVVDDTGGIDSADYAEIGRITLGTDEMAIVTHLGASSELLTGNDGPLEGTDDFSVFGGVGSAMLGATARYNLAEGISLLGGVSLIQQGYGTSDVTGVVGAAIVRYVMPGVTSFRPFVEGGLTFGGLHTNFNDVLPADASTNMLLGAVHVRGGGQMQIDDANEVTLLGSIQQTALGVDGYVLTDGGVFTATMPDQVGHFTKVKATASWRTQVTPEIDVEATGSIGALMAHGEVVADVDGLGIVTATAPTSFFVEYGARAGYDLTSNSRIEGFVQGSSSNDYGTHAQIGAAYRMSF